MVVLVQRAEAKEVIVIKQNFDGGIKPPIRKMHKGVGGMLTSDPGSSMAVEKLWISAQTRVRVSFPRSLPEAPMLHSCPHKQVS